MSHTDQANARDRERDRLFAVGMRGVRPIAGRVRVAALRAFRSGSPVDQAIDRELEAVVPQITSGMVTAHLQGRLRSKIAYSAARRDRLTLADPYRSALDFLERRLDLTADQVVDLADTYSGTSDTIVRALGADLKQSVGDTLTEVFRSGLHTSGGVARLREAFDDAGMGPTEDWQLKTLYRTQVQTAYSAGQWNANQDPAIDEILWGYRYVTVGDDRVRASHAAMDGLVAAKGDTIWETWFPPCGYNCRCTAIEIWQGDPDAVPVPLPPLVNVDGVLVAPGPDKGWEFNPGTLYRDALGLLGRN